MKTLIGQRKLIWEHNLITINLLKIKITCICLEVSLHLKIKPLKYISCLSRDIWNIAQYFKILNSSVPIPRFLVEHLSKS